MAMYRCSECDELIDGDYNPGIESPTEEFGLMCESCACEIDEVKVKPVITVDFNKWYNDKLSEEQQ